MSGKETIYLVDLTQPQCTRTYGVAPCAAVLGTTGVRKCFNTRASCQDSTHYSAGSLTTRFSLPNEGLFEYDSFIPALSAIPQMTPSAVNIAGSDPDVSAIGVREKVTLRMTDLQHSDIGFDKYRLERITGAAQSSGVGYDPYWRGTLWGKWKARNPYYISYPSYSLAVYRGYVGDDIGTFSKRTYVIDSVQIDDGKVTIVGKDLFTKLDDKKAVAPVASPGYLQADITNVQTTAVLSPVGIGNLSYPASGYGRIGDECVSFTRSADNLTITRAQLGTTADAHSHDDTFQLVLAYVGQTPQAICADLVVNYTEIPATSVNIANWNTAASNAGFFNQYTTYVTEPTPVSDLLGELSSQAGFTLFPNTLTNAIEFIPFTAGTPPVTVTDDWIVGDTLKIMQEDVKRASQVWVYYGMKDFTRSLEEETNYATRVLGIDLASEGPTQYGTPSVRKVFSRWIPQFGRANAQDTADRLIAMFRDPPVEATFEVHKDRESSFSPASLCTLTTDMVQDEDGSTSSTIHATISIAPKENSAEIQTMAVTFTPPNNNRDIYIDVATANVNIRAAYDLLFSSPIGTENVRVFVNAAAFANGGYGLDTGTFPGGQPITITISSAGGIYGQGGNGGAGGSADRADGDPANYILISSGNGSPGGTALKVRQAVTVTGTGQINGGGGGGSGGSGQIGTGASGGGGGGGGRGLSTGGNGGSAAGDGYTDGGVFSIQPGNPGSGGTLSGIGGGAGGGAGPNPPKNIGGTGGNGGDWGTAGNSGGGGVSFDSPPVSTGIGSPGAAGAAVEGNAFITWGGSLTIRGALT